MTRLTSMLDLPTFDIPRDRWGRPTIGGRTYTRVSTLAKVLDDQRALLDWSARQTAVGLSRSEDLIAAAATTDPDDRKTLNAIVEQAKERAKSKAGASIGTATHTATEILDREGPAGFDGIPMRIRDDALAYRAAIEAKGITPLAAELFVVCDPVNAAGSFDRLAQGPTRTMIVDIKTSANPDTHKWAGLSWAVQLATYANARPWLPEHGVVDWAHLGLPTPDLERGLVIHIVQGTGQVRLHSIDLTAGWAAAKLADQVLAMRKLKNITTVIP